MADFGIPESEIVARQTDGAAFDDRIDKWRRHGEPEAAKAPVILDLAAEKYPLSLNFVSPAREGWNRQFVGHFFMYYTDAVAAVAAWSDFWTTVTHDLYETEIRRGDSGFAEVVLKPLFGA